MGISEHSASEGLKKQESEGKEDEDKKLVGKCDETLTISIQDAEDDTHMDESQKEPDFIQTTQKEIREECIEEIKTEDIPQDSIEEHAIKKKKEIEKEKDVNNLD